jgi:hypothetical protein
MSPAIILCVSIPISSVVVSIQKPQYGNPVISHMALITAAYLREDPSASRAHTAPTESPLAYSNDRRVLLGEMNAPYSGNPRDMTEMKRRAAERSSVMYRKSSI